MSSIIAQLSAQKVWEQFLAYRLVKGRLNWNEFEREDEMIEREEYLPLVDDIIAGPGLSIPQKKVINKMGTGKKRVVYTYAPGEMIVLKVLAYLLYKYDDKFSPDCYAFRRGLKASDAVLRLYHKVRKKGLWAYKLDISNYFNSISIPILLEKLSNVVSDDSELYDFFVRMLSDDRAIYNGEVITEPRGAMAGVPTASFLANVYLMDVDNYFHENNIIYARYSDDIILFAEDYDTLLKYKSQINEMLVAHRLDVNPSKQRVFSPDEPYEFLGFKCSDEGIDISDSAIEKMKGKIRRKMKSVLRWKQQHNISNERAMARLIGYFNSKFFDDSESNSLNWSRWYFPIINLTEGMQIIDHYLQQCIRVLSTGKHTKANYKVGYEQLKALGYKTLIHEFYLESKEINNQ